jgi:hypothetical protein
MALNLPNIVGGTLELVFEIGVPLSRACVLFKTGSDAGTGLADLASDYASVEALFSNYRSGDIDGSAVRVGDEKALIRASQVTAFDPAPGDVITEVLTGLRREVVAARLDPTGSMWVLQCRRVSAEDWGDLGVFIGAEDWGDLAKAAVFDDLAA